jgi:tetratricopeptide (TPR) repeat protein
VAPRTRVVLLVSAAALAAAVVSVGVAALQGDERTAPAGTGSRAARDGAPPLALDLGVRIDAEARRLRRATQLLDGGRRGDAARLFARSSSLQGRVGAAMARWPEGTVTALDRLVRTHPRSGVVRLNLGLALFWQGRDEAAASAWQAALRVDPDSPSAVRADDLLHPNTPRGLPQFVPSFRPPERIVALPAARQVAALERRARTGGARARILYGVALQRLGRPSSAERQFSAAARREPRNVEALVADAVGRFRKSRPTPAFARLGPLSARFGGRPTVRFHFGLVLLWLGRTDDARRQLTLARAAAPRSALGRQAALFLKELDRAA